MNHSRRLSLSLTLLLFLFPCACEKKPSSMLQGQMNATVRFFGLAVDQDGNPLQDVQIKYQVDAYPKDWTFETRGRPYDVSFVSATSDEDGRFEFEATGCILRLITADRAGYRHLFEKSQSDKHPSVTGYDLISGGELQYQSDAKNPAIFVFVKEGRQEVSVLPSVGGARRVEKRWIPYRPAWPRQASLPDVIYKPRTGSATTLP